VKAAALGGKTTPERAAGEAQPRGDGVLVDARLPEILKQRIAHAGRHGLASSKLCHLAGQRPEPVVKGRLAGPLRASVLQELRRQGNRVVGRAHPGKPADVGGHRRRALARLVLEADLLDGCGGDAVALCQCRHESHRQFGIPATRPDPTVENAIGEARPVALDLEPHPGSRLQHRKAARQALQRRSERGRTRDGLAQRP